MHMQELLEYSRRNTAVQGGKQSTQLEGCRVRVEGFVGSVSERVSLRFVRCLVGLRVQGFGFKPSDLGPLQCVSRGFQTPRSLSYEAQTYAEAAQTASDPRRPHLTHTHTHTGIASPDVFFLLRI